MKILVVEDEAVLRNEMVDMMAAYGDCDAAENGNEAMEAVKEAIRKNDAYDIVCMDIVMPEKDGYQALKEIRDLERIKGIPEENKAKIVMVSELNEGRNVKRAFELGCDAYAGKPVNREKFDAALKKMGFVGQD